MVYSTPASRLYPTMQVTPCPIPRSWFVREPGPLPMGQTEASASTVVHHYPRSERGGWWSCEECGPSIMNLQHCRHVRAVRQGIARD